MSEKIRICHVIGSFVNGGVESVILNYFSHMDLSRYEIHIIGHGILVQECADKFSDLGFIIHNVTPKSVSISKNLKEMEKIFKEYKFDIVHSHLTEGACVPMFLAWKCGIKIRINHSHMAEKPSGLKNKIYYGIRLFFGKLFSTDYFACGRDAGIYLFGKRAVDSGKVIILPNAIDYKCFKYDIEKREKIREKNNINDSTVIIGHVGRFFEQKNHEFLIDIFEEYHRRNPDSALVMVCEGELMKKIREKVHDMKLEAAVRFLGNRSDVADWYQLMDVFVMPSFYEGFPVVGVEAQAAGLPCLFADTITSEIQISSKAFFISLDKEKEGWADEIERIIIDMPNRNNLILEYDRFDITRNAGKLDQFYKRRVFNLK